MSGSRYTRLVRAVTFCALLATAALWPPQALAAEEAPYVVVFKGSVGHPGEVARAQAARNGGEIGYVYRYALKGYSTTLSEAEAKALEHDPRVDFVSRDRRAGTFAQTNPTGVERIFATANAKLDIDEVNDVKINADVAVLDTGVFKHGDLLLQKFVDCVPVKKFEEPNAKECKEATPLDEDGNGHGTHVAGTIGAIDNTTGVVGVAPSARIWGVRVMTLNAKGVSQGTEAWIAAGLDWVAARAEEIEVANMSLGCGGLNEKKEAVACTMGAVETAVTGAVEKGVVVVVAAGNDKLDAEKYVSPAKNPNAITVSAIADYNGEAGGGGASTCASKGADDQSYDMSNFGKVIDVTAPGVCILSTSNKAETYAELFGTSMATPHVSGAAAILAAQSNPATKADVEKIRNIIAEKGNLGWTDNSGDGIKEKLLDVSNEEFFK